MNFFFPQNSDSICKERVLLHWALLCLYSHAKYNVPFFFLLSTFMHFFVEAFLFPLKDGSFHLLPLFSFTAKEKLSPKGSRI